MKKRVIFGGLLSMIFLISFVNASFNIGNISHEIITSYGSEELIRGWFNISLENEPANSQLTAFDYNISIFDFLEQNNADFSCIPENCEKGYSVIDSGESSKSIVKMNPFEWLLGVKLHGQVSGINNFKFDFLTTAQESCLIPLKIDIGDDEIFEWISENVTEEVCEFPSSGGCFNESEAQEETQLYENFFCEEVSLPPFKSFKLGGVINGSGSANFEMTLEVGGELVDCNIPVIVGGEIGCDVELEEALKETSNGEVCIRKISGADYTIKLEDNSTCGYVKNTYGENIAEHDFEIFAKPKKYAKVNNFIFNQEFIDDEEINLAEIIWDYIKNNYNNGDCSNDCIIPIRFYFGTMQESTISNLVLDYTSGGLLESESNIYNIEESSVLLNSDFLKLDLEKAGFYAPSEFGTEQFILNLNDEEIFNEEIEVKALPQIIDLVPKNIPALVSFPITLVLSDNFTRNLTFIWDFGDGQTATSQTNTIEHSYSKIGSYDIEVTIKGISGELSKIFTITTGAPEEYINETIFDYRNSVELIEKEINKLPEWIKKEIEKKIELDTLKTELNILEKKYEDAFEPDEYVAIMSQLLDLKIPTRFGISQSISSFDFFPNEEQFDLESLETMGAGTAEESRKVYAGAVNNWIRTNLKLLLESKTYSLFYEDIANPIFSYIKINLEPIDSLNEFYFIINGNPEEIVFSQNLNQREIGEIATGITFTDLTKSQIIEFLYPGQIDMQNIPIYLSPRFSKLETGVVPGPCNNNGICEEGENYKNCRGDCKPIGWTIFWLILLFFIAFVIYIALQEWYKRHYESKLFPNKSQLFNLVNFMSISLNQGIKRSEIYDKLREMGWNKEQLNYVWNKLHGKRTGMWEIPIFKWVEKKQVKREIEKRQSVNKGLPSK